MYLTAILRIYGEESTREYISYTYNLNENNPYGKRHDMWIVAEGNGTDITEYNIDDNFARLLEMIAYAINPSTKMTKEYIVENRFEDKYAD